MDEIVYSETRPGVMEPRQGLFKRVVHFLAEEFPTERVLGLVTAAALWGIAAWGIHEFLEKLSVAMGTA
jgi:hypothetical protein